MPELIDEAPIIIHEHPSTPARPLVALLTTPMLIDEPRIRLIRRSSSHRGHENVRGKVRARFTLTLWLRVRGRVRVRVRLKLG